MNAVAISYRSITPLETCYSLLSAGELLLGHDAFEHLERVIPEGVMFLVEQHDEASRLRVERRWDMQHGILDDGHNLLVRDGRFLVDGVVSSTLLDGLHEGFARSHGGGGRKGLSGARSWRRIECLMSRGYGQSRALVSSQAASRLPANL